MLEVFRANVGRNGDQRTYAHQRAREWLGNQQAIPGIQSPFTVDGYVEYRHGNPRRTCQQHRAGLGEESRALGTVDRKRHGVARLNFLTHAEQTAHRPTTARTANRHKTKAPDHAGSKFAIETGAAHHPDIEIAPQVGCRESALVPKRIYKGPLLQTYGRVLFAGHCKLHGGANQTHGNRRAP